MAAMGRTSSLCLLSCWLIAVLTLIGEVPSVRAEEAINRTKVTSVGWSGSGLLIVYHVSVVRRSDAVEGVGEASGCGGPGDGRGQHSHCNRHASARWCCTPTWSWMLSSIQADLWCPGSHTQLQVLVRSGLYKPGQTVTAGSSGGALVAFASTVGVNAFSMIAIFSQYLGEMVETQEECMAANASATANECNPAL